MENYKIGFVILHYNVIEETKICVQSIIDKIDTTEYEIIIVDNGSSNNTGDILKNTYKDYPNIHVIINKENLGFSKGNNIGFRCAKNEFECDFIVMINNDTYLVQNDFFSIVKKEYEKSKFAVLGPKILLKDNKVCEMNGKLITLREEKRYLFNLRVKLLLNYICLDNIVLGLKNKIFNEKEEKDFTYLNTRRENVVLHGCALIFSPIYIKKFDGIDEKTFLYREEEFLYLNLRKHNMLSVYNPRLLIFHNEAVATKNTNSLKRKKDRFVYKNLISANKVFLQELKKYQK